MGGSADWQTSFVIVDQPRRSLHSNLHPRLSLQAASLRLHFLPQEIYVRSQLASEGKKERIIGKSLLGSAVDALPSCTLD